jgi:hypothetical protein
MTVQYENEENDVIEWLCVRSGAVKVMEERERTERVCYARMAGISIAVLMGIVAFAAIPSLSVNMPIRVMTLLSIASSLTLLWSIIGFKTTNYRASLCFQAIKALTVGGFTRFMGEQTVSLLPEGLKIVENGGETLTRRQHLKRWDATETHLALYWFQDKPVSEAHLTLIPKRAFRDAAHLCQFLEALEMYREATTTKLPTESLIETSTVRLPPTNMAVRWWQNPDAETNEVENLRRGG